VITLLGVAKWGFLAQIVDAVTREELSGFKKSAQGKKKFYKR
jgi:hypothetical protein